MLKCPIITLMRYLLSVFCDQHCKGKKDYSERQDEQEKLHFVVTCLKEVFTSNLDGFIENKSIVWK